MLEEEKNDNVNNLKSEENPKDKKKKSGFMEDLKIVVLAILIALFVRNFVFNLAVVNQTSMYPTLHPKNVVVVNRINDLRKNYNRGDIIIFKSPEDSKNLIKRLIGLPGETVEIKDGEVFINGQKLEEDYLQDGVYTDSIESKFILKDDEFFAMGDNREGSFDCRNFGPVKTKALMGTTTIRILPFSAMGKIDKKK